MVIEWTEVVLLAEKDFFFHLRSSNKSTKAQLADILSKEWPLSAKELFNRTKKMYANSASYQAIHKSLSEMVMEGALQKRGKEFELNPKWLTSLKTYINNLESNYQKQNPRKISVTLENTQQIQFNDWSNFCLEMARILQSPEIIKVKDFECASMLNHMWWPPNFSFEDFHLLSEMISAHKGKDWLICRNNSPLDEWIQKEYTKGGGKGIQSKLGVSFYSENELIAAGEHVFEISQSPETKKFIDSIYQKSKNLEGLFDQFQENNYEKFPFQIGVKVTKNAQIAKTIQSHVKSFFK